jgi:hypothetical protein
MVQNGKVRTGIRSFRSQRHPEAEEADATNPIIDSNKWATIE